jgi:Mrp family chromosome partitioning ATPase/capsular polysaccharide biosynthesis protein
VSHDAAEALFGALRRALPLIVICAITTAVVVNLQRQLNGPLYSASASVYLSSRDLASILTNTQTPYVDPQRANENAVALARSIALYNAVSRATPSLGTSGQIRSRVTVAVDPNSDVITFSATDKTERRAVATVNAVTTRYVRFRSNVSGAAIDEAIERLRASLVKPSTNKAQTRELLQRLELQQTLNSGDAIVINPAQGATKIAPAPVRDTILGVALGFVIALLISGVREFASTRVRSERDVEDIVGRPVIAAIPRLPKGALIVAIGRYEARFGDTYALLAASIEQENREPGDRNGQAVVMAVTSAIAGEGKTTTAANLGVAMAKRGLRVVIVDFDLRKPSLGRVFRLPAQSDGVLQVIRSDQSVDSVMWSYPISGNVSSPQRVSEENRRTRIGTQPRIPLVVVPSGGSDRSSIASRSPRALAMIEHLRNEADLVIIDTPPALLTAEMAELSGAVDGVIVVVRYGGPTRRDLAQLARQATTWQAGIRGVVLTAAPTSSERQQYYYRE